VFERFTENAKRVVSLAQREAMSLGHDHIGTEHLLLGMVNTEDGLGGTASEVLTGFGVTLPVARDEAVRILTESGRTGTGGASDTAALAAIGIDLDEIRRRADETFGPGRFQFPKPPFTLQAKQALKYALSEALHLGHKFIGTEHLLLGILRDSEGVAVTVLGTLGVDAAEVRKAVLARIPEGTERRVDWDRIADEIVRLKMANERDKRDNSTD
jgi:ATP-dependent Clp protease ATP-binding subunit ClpA